MIHAFSYQRQRKKEKPFFSPNKEKKGKSKDLP
jgi:hypothetical protein